MQTPARVRPAAGPLQTAFNGPRASAMSPSDSSPHTPYTTATATSSAAAAAARNGPAPGGPAAPPAAILSPSSLSARVTTSHFPTPMELARSGALVFPPVPPSERALWASTPLAKLRESEAAQRAQITAKRQELRSLVTRCFRQLLSSADTIIAMDGTATALHERISSLDALLNSIDSSLAVDGASGDGAGAGALDSASASAAASSAAAAATAAATASVTALTGAVSSVWAALRGGDELEAAVGCFEAVALYTAAVNAANNVNTKNTPNAPDSKTVSTPDTTVLNGSLFVEQANAALALLLAHAPALTAAAAQRTLARATAGPDALARATLAHSLATAAAAAAGKTAAAAAAASANASDATATGSMLPFTFGSGSDDCSASAKQQQQQAVLSFLSARLGVARTALDAATTALNGAPGSAAASARVRVSESVRVRIVTHAIATAVQAANTAFALTPMLALPYNISVAGNNNNSNSNSNSSASSNDVSFKSLEARTADLCVMRPNFARGLTLALTRAQSQSQQALVLSNARATASHTAPWLLVPLSLPPASLPATVLPLWRLTEAALTPRLNFLIGLLTTAKEVAAARSALLTASTAFSASHSPDTSLVPANSAPVAPASASLSHRCPLTGVTAWAGTPATWAAAAAANLGPSAVAATAAAAATASQPAGPVVSRAPSWPDACAEALGARVGAAAEAVAGRLGERVRATIAVFTVTGLTVTAGQRDAYTAAENVRGAGGSAPAYSWMSQADCGITSALCTALSIYYNNNANSGLNGSVAAGDSAIATAAAVAAFRAARAADRARDRLRDRARVRFTNAAASADATALTVVSRSHS